MLDRGIWRPLVAPLAQRRRVMLGALEHVVNGHRASLPGRAAVLR